jgi:hypothetical protein
VVANNVVTRNLARGIQLYPNAMHVEVIHNTIVRNGRAGVQLGGKASHNEITNNIIAANGDAGIRSHALTGVGNRGARNLLWRNGGDEDGPQAEPAGVELTGTIVADPELTGDWCPGAGSPAVDRASASDIARDGFGRLRRRAASRPDIGACERRP